MGRKSKSGMSSGGGAGNSSAPSAGGGGGTLRSTDRTSGTLPSARQAADDMYDELTNYAYQPEAAAYAASMVTDGDNLLNYYMNQRYGYGHKNGSASKADPDLIKAQQAGAQRWINDNPEKMNRAIKKESDNSFATKISKASPFSKSPDSAPAGTVLRMGDWKYTKSKSGAWSASKSGKRQSNRTNADIKRVFS